LINKDIQSLCKWQTQNEFNSEKELSKNMLRLHSVTLPTLVNVGDYISLFDSKSFWSINNLIVVTQNNQKFKNASGLIDAPLVCDVSGASVELIWEGTYWRVSA